SVRRVALPHLHRHQHPQLRHDAVAHDQVRRQQCLLATEVPANTACVTGSTTKVRTKGLVSPALNAALLPVWTTANECETLTPWSFHGPTASRGASTASGSCCLAGAARS